MQTKSGVLQFNKTEEKEMRTVLQHCKIDLSYGVDGSFNNGEDKLDTKEMARARKGIELIEWILEAYK